MAKRKIVFIRAALVAYCLILVYFLYFNGRSNAGGMPFGEYIKSSVNYIPFRYIKYYFYDLVSNKNFHYVIVNLLGNVVVFIPLGFLLPVNFKGIVPFKKYLPLAVSLPVFIELVQLIFRLGCCDIDDVILNIIGLLSGYLIYKGLIKNRNE